MRELLNVNFSADDLEDGDFEALFCRRRRDAGFAYVYERDGRTIAVRDHLGTVPLYYRSTVAGLRFSTSLSTLVAPGDALRSDGLEVFLSLGTSKLAPLVDGIGIIPPGTAVAVNDAGFDTLYQYRFTPRTFPAFISQRALVTELERLFTQAVRRTIRSDVVGLYLSGGIDSALIGVHLRRAGVRVNAYTSAPWGRTSSEIPFAETNARVIGVDKHEVDYLETARYAEIASSLLDIYGAPHATLTSIGVASLWLNTAISSERQLYFGQNSDTLACAVPAQYVTYFLNLLPRVARARIRASQRHPDLIANYLAYSGVPVDLPDKRRLPYDAAAMSRVQKLILAGMLLVHTPADGEVLLLPALQRGMIVSDPYYDVDLIEFFLGIPLLRRLALTKESKLFLAFEKHTLQQLARRHLPPELVQRKKAFTIPFERDDDSRAFVSALPHEVSGRRVKSTARRLAAAVLLDWMRQYDLTAAKAAN